MPGQVAKKSGSPYPLNGYGSHEQQYITKNYAFKLAIPLKCKYHWINWENDLKIAQCNKSLK